MDRCPTCNSPLPHQARRIIDDLRIRPQQRAILEILDDHLGQWVHMDRIVMLLHQSDPNGGPFDPKQCVRVQICRLRRVLEAGGVPLQIETDSLGQGGRGYRLILTEAEAA